jgi:hypothetical protein
LIAARIWCCADWNSRPVFLQNARTPIPAARNTDAWLNQTVTQTTRKPSRSAQDVKVRNAADRPERMFPKRSH